MSHEEPEKDSLDGTPFRALSKLGEGAMGIVLLAEHRILQKRVAVKLLHTELLNDPSLIDRLRVEAEVLAHLSNPHVVEVLDCGMTSAGAPYIAMELLVGRSLQEELKRRGYFPVEEALDLMRQAVRGVIAAHALGIVHRDIKPANLFYCIAEPSAPLVKVLDFGVAKILSGPVNPLNVDTAAGMMIGSPKTMSPEAFLGTGVDARSDVYSLGIVLYMLVAGRAPFEDRKELIEYARAHVTEVPVAPSAAAEQVIPPSVDAIVLRALEKEPGRRFQTADALYQALALALSPDSRQAMSTVVRHEPLPAYDDNVVANQQDPKPFAGQTTSPWIMVGFVLVGAFGILAFLWLVWATRTPLKATPANAAASQAVAPGSSVLELPMASPATSDRTVRASSANPSATARLPDSTKVRGGRSLPLLPTGLPSATTLSPPLAPSVTNPNIF